MDLLPRPEEFVFNLEDIDALYDPVFEPLPRTGNKTLNGINSCLKDIGMFARLYYNLRNIYGKTMPASTFKKESEVRLKIYEAEKARRAIYQKFFENHPPISVEENPFNDAETIQIGNMALAIINAIIVLPLKYEAARSQCLYSTNISRLTRADRIYRVRDAETKYYENNEERMNYSRETIDAALKNICENPPTH